MEDIPIWLIWLCIGLVLAMLELAVPGMILIFFSLGCFISAAVAYFFSDAVTIQVAIFCVASVGFLIALRSIFMNWFQGKSSEKEDDGYDDSPEGALAEATKDFSQEGYGQIKYRGSFWKAVSESDQPIAAGEKVKIVSWSDKSKTSFLITKIK